jgi:hypothetical protein
MAFADKYMGALAASNLLDDELHHKTEPLQAAALADRSARHIGALLHRVKYAGTVIQKLAHAIAARARVEKELAEAVRKKDDRRQADCRQALDANAATCAMAGSDAAAFRTLCLAWCEIVDKKGRDRHWIKPADWPKIGHLAPEMFRRIAEHSLAHYLDDICKTCNGIGSTGAKPILCACKACSGTRKASLGSAAELGISSYELKLVGDMVAELAALEQTHAGAAGAKLRREE